MYGDDTTRTTSAEDPCVLEHKMNRTYREKRNKIIKFFRAPYMVLDSYKVLQIPTVT